MTDINDHIQGIKHYIWEWEAGVISLQQLHIEVIALREMIDYELENRMEEVMKSD